MDTNNVFAINKSSKTLSMLIVLGLLPNLIGMINLPTVFGFKIHIFQYFVFIAAILYGPVGGAISGGFGSIYSAFAMNNPYLIIGNIILGFVFGYFVRKKKGIIPSVLIAYAVQMPWLYISDIYFLGLSSSFVMKLMGALLIFDFLWALLAQSSYKSIERMVG